MVKKLQHLFVGYRLPDTNENINGLINEKQIIIYKSWMSNQAHSQEALYDTWKSSTII